MNMWERIKEPFVLRGAAKLLGITGLDLVGSMEKLREIVSEDVVGFVPKGGIAVEMRLVDALRELEDKGGYITGWEYLAGDQMDKLGRLVEKIDVTEWSVFDQLGEAGVHGAHELSMLMKWIFISHGGDCCSDWHVDPVGSHAWMLMVTGKKRWEIKLPNGTVRVENIGAGDLIVVPAGFEHRVENIGEQLNVAISHNWVGKGQDEFMWNELEKGLVKLNEFVNHGNFYEQLQIFQGTHVDNILFGLIMIFIHLDEDQLSFIIPQRRYSLKQLLELIRSMLLSS